MSHNRPIPGSGTAYRTAAIVARRKRPTAGIIRAPAPIKPPPPPRPHVCAPPGIFARLFYLLTFRRLYRGSLWRCECGSVHILETRYPGESSPLEWMRTNQNSSWDRVHGNTGDAGIRMWEERGGAK